MPHQFFNVFLLSGPRCSSFNLSFPWLHPGVSYSFRKVWLSPLGSWYLKSIQGLWDLTLASSRQRFLPCIVCTATYLSRVPKGLCSSLILHFLCPLSGGSCHHFSYTFLTLFHNYSSINCCVMFSDHLRIPPDLCCWQHILCNPLSHDKEDSISFLFCF